MKRVLAAAAAVLGALVSLPARADDAHYENFLPGERAAGMGGAFTALANDPSGTYFNPAGLVDLESDELSANLNFYGFQQQSLQKALSGASGNLLQGLSSSVGAAFNQLNTVPGLAGSVHNIGGKDPLTGKYRQAWALSVLVPDDTSLTETTFNVDSQGNLQSLSQTTIDQTALAALGYGYRLDEKLSLGFSANALYRHIDQRSRAISAVVAAGSSGNGVPSTAFFLDDVSLDLTVVGLFAQGGVLWKPLPQLSLGATLATPTWTVYSSALADEVQASGGTLTEYYQPNLQGDSRWPIHGRIGAAYEFLPGFLVALDLSLWGVSHYALVRAPAVGLRLPDFVNGVDREVTGNINLGVEYKLFHKYPVRAGFFTNTSSAPSIDSSSSPQLNDINLYGFTLGATLPGGHSSTTVGVSYSFGNGTSKTPTAVTAQNALSYQAGPASEIFLDLFAGGTVQF